ncbi:MAG: hypothetical protein ACYDEX_09740 [Mobilitalea sp.]
MQKRVIVYAHLPSGIKNGMQQLHELGEFLGTRAVNEEYELVGVMSEITDKHLYERRGFIQCIELIARDEIDGVYVLNASNVSPDKQEVIEFVQSIVEAGAFVKSVKRDLPCEEITQRYENNASTNTDEPTEFVLFYRF